MTLVRFGSGELGRDGGSWVGAGVLASFDMFGAVVVEAVRMRFWRGSGDACADTRRVSECQGAWLEKAAFRGCRDEMTMQW